MIDFNKTQWTHMGSWVSVTTLAKLVEAGSLEFEPYKGALW